MTRATPAAVAVAGVLAACGGDSGTEYGAAFQSPSGVEAGDAIVLGGETIGEVEKVEEEKLNALEFEQAELRVEEGGPRLYRDVRLIARGDRVQVDPGDANSAPLHEGHIVPMTQTRSEGRR